jgi:formate-dependent nitrite reductase membrane component NrfD
VIHAAHWGWMVVVYFFLGGIAGASYTIATIANLVSQDREVERAARYLSFAAILPCPLLLVLDLGRPDRFLHMLRIVKLRSPMSLGSWALVAMGGLASLGAGLQALADISGRDVLRGPRRAVGIVGLPFSVFLSGYTGILLAATNVPIWWRAFPLLSPTFISSAYSTSLAAMSVLLGLGGERQDTHRKLARADAMCLAIELSALTGAVLRMGSIGRPLTRGRLGRVFWPVTYVGGVLLPLLLQLNGPAQGEEISPLRRNGTALLVLIGGFSLRALMIFAGRESANRPEDYFAMTRKR